MTSKIKYYSISIIFFCFIMLSDAQINKNNFYPAIGINIGINSEKSCTFGFNFDYRYQIGSESARTYTGLSFSYQFDKIKDRFHKIKTINLLLGNEYLSLKPGIGLVKYGWGYNDRNLCRTKGLNLEMSASYNLNKYPGLYFRNFVYRKRNWAWHTKNYYSYGLRYDYSFLK